MRVYVEDFDPKKIDHRKLLKLEEYYSGKNDIIEVFSEQGIYLVENSKIWKLVTTNDKTTNIVIRFSS